MPSSSKLTLHYILATSDEIDLGQLTPDPPLVTGLVTGVNCVSSQVKCKKATLIVDRIKNGGAPSRIGFKMDFAPTATGRDTLRKGEFDHHKIAQLKVQGSTNTNRTRLS
jgi:hypothetical protein